MKRSNDKNFSVISSYIRLYLKQRIGKMSLNKMMLEHRKKELIAIFKFISKADVEELARIISEIRVWHDNILVFNQNDESLNKVISISINDDCIQLNLE
jgi:predicted AAA+ superfamily ATPase